MYLYIDKFHRYLGLFRDYIVPAVLYRFKTLVADTSMITLSTEYSIHFHDLYIDGKENAKMTDD
jgi:hypothetical protein